MHQHRWRQLIFFTFNYFKSSEKVEQNHPRWVRLFTFFLSVLVLLMNFFIWFLGLNFAGFIDAFFLLAQRKSSSSATLFESVNDLTQFCLEQMNLNHDERM